MHDTIALMTWQLAHDVLLVVFCNNAVMSKVILICEKAWQFDFESDWVLVWLFEQVLNDL